MMFQKTYKNLNSKIFIIPETLKPYFRYRGLNLKKTNFKISYRGPKKRHFFVFFTKI